MSGEVRNRSLAFTVSRGLARAEARTVAAHLDLVAPLVRKISRNGTNDDSSTSPGRALFELLRPAALKDRSADERPGRLILDERSAGFPWELLDDRRPWMSDEAELAPPSVRAGWSVSSCRRGSAKMSLRRRARPKRWSSEIRTARRPTCPTSRGPRKRPKPSPRLLGGTLRDAACRRSSGAGPDNAASVYRCRGDHPHLRPWRVERAGRRTRRKKDEADRDYARRRRGAGPVGAGEDSNEPGDRFINCCHLGVGPINLEGRPEFAANVAIELVKLGARCVIAAGWAIDDNVAAESGRAFYEPMLSGETFRKATLLARQAAYRANRNSSTFGAYQCYGDPDYRLRANKRRKGGDGAQSFVAVSEAIEAVRQLRDDLNIGLERKLDALKDRLNTLEGAAQEWLGKVEQRVALAEAWGELGDIPKAIEHYTAAVRSSDASFKVKAIEQLANLSVRNAVVTLRVLPPEKRDPAKTLEEIKAWLRKIEGLTALLAETRERVSLQGSCWKRLAQVEPASGEAPLRAEEDGRVLRLCDGARRCARQALSATHRLPRVHLPGCPGGGGLRRRRRGPAQSADRRCSSGRRGLLGADQLGRRKMAEAILRSETNCRTFSPPTNAPGATWFACEAEIGGRSSSSTGHFLRWRAGHRGEAR